MGKEIKISKGEDKENKEADKNWTKAELMNMDKESLCIMIDGLFREIAYYKQPDERRCPNHDVPLKYNINSGLHVCPECGYVG